MLSNLSSLLIMFFLIHWLANYMESRAIKKTLDKLIKDGEFKDGDIIEITEFYNKMVKECPAIERWLALKYSAVLCEVITIITGLIIVFKH